MFENHSQSEIQLNKNESCNCQASMGNGGKCGETKTLEILKEFQQLYENKLSEITEECSCTSTRLKIQMLEDWVKDLTEQNTMLVQVVEELEQEASERVSLLEEKLRHSSKTSFEIMKTLQAYDAQNISSQSDALQRLMYVQSDVNNLTEFIRRIRDEGKWSTEGLHFYSVSQDALCEVLPKNTRNFGKLKDLEENLMTLKVELAKSKQKKDEYELETKRKELLIREQTEQIEKLNEVVERCSNSVPDRQKLLEELHDVRTQLKAKKEDFSCLELSMKDMREALTAEVADKHDSIVALRRECQLLEERCRQADKQTHFKDDIIKEMRKELKQYRSKLDLEGKLQEDEDLKKKIIQLQDENNELHKTISSANEELNVLHELIRKYYNNGENNGKFSVICKMQKNMSNTKISEEFYTNNSSKDSSDSNLIYFVKESLSYIEKYCGELLAMTRENKEQNETINKLKNKVNMPSKDMLVLHEAPDKMSFFSDSETDFHKTISILKTDISKMILWKSENEVTELKKHVSSIENSLHDIQSKDQLIKTKDEMIAVQNDTLDVAQKELQVLREHLSDLERDRDSKIQEIQNLQQALTINQNTIEALEKALKNADEKSNNIQQTADLYVETITLLENAKLKAETEVEQQRITIRNLQEALLNVKKQLEGAQGHSAAELKSKTDAIYTLHQELDEIQRQYMDCYGENVKLSQTTDCLRDANLELKATNFELQQDIGELNSKITNDKIKITSLEERVQKIIAANMLLEEDINYMKEEMGNLSSELRVLQGLLKLSSSSPSLEEHNLSLTKSLTVLQQHSEALIDQLRMSQKQVTRELKLNDMNLSKITELQKLLESKSEELEETKTQLDVSLLKRKEYENKINSMEESIKEYQKIQEINERKDEMVLNCNSDLICLNEKIEILNQILNEKSNEILRLHAELSIKSDNISCLVKENEITIKDNKKLTQNALNLEGQLAMYKTRCDDLNEKYNKCKAELEKIKNWGDSVHERYKQERKNLLDKLEQVKIEESELNIKLEKSVEQLEKTKLSLMHKDEEVKHLSSAQDEILLLKEEINRLTKQRSRVLSENQRLQEQINSLNISSSQLENRNLIISQQLDKCLQELSTLQLTKDKLEEKNIHLETEVEHLQRAFSELNQEIRYRSESLMSLEQELSETKCSRDEICAESRIVVLNVRSWLDEQKRINIALNETLKEKNLCIEELTMEKNLLMKNIKDLCERYESLTEELHVSRQFMTDCIENKPQSRKSLTPVQRSLYTWGSQNSAGESRTSSPLFIEEHYDYSFDDDREPNPAKWMRKVNDMTEDILNSKKFWKTKMSKSKRIKPVKDSKTSIAKTT